MDKLIVPRGSKVEIHHPQYGVIVGTVRTAINYGTNEKPDWYMELMTQDGASYWKQNVDGGVLDNVIDPYSDKVLYSRP